MTPPRSRIAHRAAAFFVPSLLVGLAAGAAAAPTNGANASAYGVSDSQTGPANVVASANNPGQGGPGTSASRASAGLGTVAGWGTMSGCTIAFPPFQQICNDANESSTFTDVVSVVSDAPFGTPVDVQASYDVEGHVGGTGVYAYGSGFDFASLHFSGPSASTGGTTAMNVDQAIGGSGSQTVTLATGHGYGIDGQCNLDVGDRFCDGGSGNCDVSNTGWSLSLWLRGTLTLSVPALPPGATYVHLLGSSGHDYALTATAVGDARTGVEGLSPAHPNPAPGSSRLELTLTRARAIDVGVFDLAGRRVATLVHGVLEPGMHELAWDGRDDRGTPARGGMYLVRARAGDFESTQRILRLR